MEGVYLLESFETHKNEKIAFESRIFIEEFIRSKDANLLQKVETKFDF